MLVNAYTREQITYGCSVNVTISRGVIIEADGSASLKQTVIDDIE